MINKWTKFRNLGILDCFVLLVSCTFACQEATFCTLFHRCLWGNFLVVEGTTEATLLSTTPVSIILHLVWWKVLAWNEWTPPLFRELQYRALGSSHFTVNFSTLENFKRKLGSLPSNPKSLPWCKIIPPLFKDYRITFHWPDQKLRNKQSMLTMRSRVKFFFPLINPTPEQISARQLTKLAGELHRPCGCRAQSRKANSCCSLIWVKIVWVFSLAHGFGGDWQLGQTKSFRWLPSQAALLVFSGS